MARPIWTGSISFGLVTVPVRLFPATSPHKTSFRQFERGTNERVRYRRVAEESQHEVDYDDIVKGAEVGKGEYVMIEPEELEAIQPGRNRAIEIEDFVDLDEIDPIAWNDTYYLGPTSDNGADKPYQLLLEAMRATNKVAIARFVLRAKQYLATIRPLGEGMLALETMYFADEIRSADDVDGVPVSVDISDRERKMAEQLIESMAEPWDHSRYADTYEEKVRELIDRKARGEEIVTEDGESQGGEVVDLMDALRASMESTQRAEHPTAGASTAQGASQGGSSSGDSATDYEDMSKEELYRAAADAGVSGRSKMSKEDLIEALRYERVS